MSTRSHLLDEPTEDTSAPERPEDSATQPATESGAEPGDEPSVPKRLAPESELIVMGAMVGVSMVHRLIDALAFPVPPPAEYSDDPKKILAWEQVQENRAGVLRELQDQQVELVKHLLDSAAAGDLELRALLLQRVQGLEQVLAPRYGVRAIAKADMERALAEAAARKSAAQAALEALASLG